MTDDQILKISNGEVKNANSINYQTEKSIADGLFCNRIFGGKHYKCQCEKYVGKQYEGITCDVCGVTVLPQSKILQRSGHIQLNEPIIFERILNSF